MSRPLVSICTERTSARLEYVIHWLFRERLGFDVEIVQQPTENPYSISYGLTGDVTMPDAGLLWETDIRPQHIQSAFRLNLYTLYNDEANSDFPFDLFSSIFYLLSRYEEYLSFCPDSHGRYPHETSMLGRDGVLERPVVDEWVEWFRKFLEDKWALSLPKNPFRFQPSYDIDIAWSYKNKGWKRWLGGAGKDVFSGRFPALGQRISVALLGKKDPYDAFGWMKNLHEKHKLQPHYFILAALNASPFDKNISPKNAAMKSLIQALQAEGEIGIHPSYYTKENLEKLTIEKQTLENIIDQKINISRQHFIRLFIPATYRMLLAAGIKEDYSMGYSTALGFRAGTSHSFFWYDFQQEQTTMLRVHPFCFMDTTAHFDQRLNVQEAFQRLQKMTKCLQDCGGILTTVFHNFSLGTDQEWEGWQEGYAAFLATCTCRK